MSVFYSLENSFWSEVRSVVRLAVPVALAELGWVSMNVVDTIMVGHLGPTYIGAIAVGGSAFYPFAVFGLGLLLGLDTLVSQSFGAGNRDDCHCSLAQGLYLAFFLTPVLMLLFLTMPGLFFTFGIDPEVSRLAGSFIRTLSLSILPLLLYGAFRRYLQGIGHVRPIMFALVSANLVNWFFNWILIGGRFGFPALGVVGSALSTGLARLYMAALLGVCIWWYERGTHPGFANIFRAPDLKRIIRLLQIGVPAATQILLEIGAFGAAAILAGRLNPVSLAAHQIAINVASVSFMVPLGTSSAAAVAVGHAIGRGKLYDAQRGGFIAIGLVCVFAVCATLAFLLVPHQILTIYTNDARVLAIGVNLLAFAAAFQVFDAIQAVTTGALRGLGNTRVPMLVNLGGYWFFGLPVGYLLCFHLGYGIYGLWCGLTLSLFVIAVILFYSWQIESTRLVRSAAER